MVELTVLDRIARVVHSSVGWFSALSRSMSRGIKKRRLVGSGSSSVVGSQDKSIRDNLQIIDLSMASSVRPAAITFQSWHMYSGSFAVAQVPSAGVGGIEGFVWRPGPAAME